MTYKKMYVSPIIEVERFDMDIDIAAVDQAWLDSLKEFYKSSLPQGTEPTDEGFREWLSTYPGFDNDTSGICYYTAGTLS